MLIATLIAADRLGEGDISAAVDALAEGGFGGARVRWIEAGRACDLLLDRGSGQSAREVRTILEKGLSGADVVVQPERHRAKKLLVADMDSTMISVECIDELADYAGLKAEVAAVTERAMQGELDFERALDARVALLAGLEEAAIERCRIERVRLTPGAATLVRTMRRNGAHCLLVSGGFEHFARPVADEIGFDAALANRLEMAAGKLSGTVARPVIDGARKRLALIEAAADRGLGRAEIMAVGDGANDIPMIAEAGLGVAFHAKPAAADAADARIRHNDLTALLFAQGYARKDWAN